MWAKFVFICLQYVSLLVMKGRPQHCILSVPLSTKLAAWKTQWCSARSKRRYSFGPSRGAVVAITRSLERTLLTINARSVCVRARGHIVRWRLEKFRVCHHLATVWCGALGASSYACYLYLYAYTPPTVWVKFRNFSKRFHYIVHPAVKPTKYLFHETCIYMLKKSHWR